MKALWRPVPRICSARAKEPRRRLLLLVNPNTSEAITHDMMAIASTQAGEEWIVRGVTAGEGAAVIDDEPHLFAAADHVPTLAREVNLLRGVDAVLVCAFGDPGLEGLRAALPMRVAGIGEAALRKASRNGRRFAVVTTTPLLEKMIREKIARLGLAEQCAALRFTHRHMADLLHDERCMAEALSSTCEAVLRNSDVHSIVIGGGPLAKAARTFGHTMRVPLIDPVAAGVETLLSCWELNPHTPTW